MVRLVVRLVDKLGKDGHFEITLTSVFALLISSKPRRNREAGTKRRCAGDWRELET